MDLNLILSVVSLAINVILGIGMAYIASKQGEIKDLKDKLETATAEQVDQRLAAWEKQCDLRHAAMDRRLASGDEHFRSTDAQQREVERQLLLGMAELREKMATRDDLKNIWEAIRTVKHG
jgi:chromosome segregation ATPase